MFGPYGKPSDFEKAIEFALIRACNGALEDFAEELRNYNLHGRMEIASKIERHLRIEEKP
jgi:hypothetical protein